jgi:hypothetical protein
VKRLQENVSIKDHYTQHLLYKHAKTINSLILNTSTDWHTVGGSGQPAFEGDWENKGSPYYNLAYYKDTQNRLFLRGRVRGTPNSIIFTLPVGFRPDNVIVLAVISQYEAGGVSDPGGRIEIHPDGSVKYFIT